MFVLFGIQGSVSEKTTHLLFEDKFHDKHKIWQNLCLLHMNITHWAQIIVLFDLQSTGLEISVTEDLGE